MRAALLIAVTCLSIACLVSFTAAQHSIQRADMAEALSQELAAINVDEARGEHVLNPPEDGKQYATMLLTSDDWQKSAAERRLVASFDSSAKLRSLKTTTHFFHFTPSDQLWRTRYAPKYRGSTPMLRIQDYDGAVLYEHFGPTLLTKSPAELVADIETEIASCGPRPDRSQQDAAQPEPKRPWFIPSSIELRPTIYPTLNIAFGSFPYVLTALAIIAVGLWYHLEE